MLRHTRQQICPTVTVVNDSRSSSRDLLTYWHAESSSCQQIHRQREEEEEEEEKEEEEDEEKQEDV